MKVRMTPIGEVLELRSQQIGVDPFVRYRQVGLRSFVLRSVSRLNVLRVSWRTFSRLKTRKNTNVANAMVPAMLGTPAAPPSPAPRRAPRASPPP